MNGSIPEKIEIKGEKHFLTEWFRILGLTEGQKGSVYKRIRRGMEPAEALTKPFATGPNSNESICWKYAHAIPNRVDRGCSWSRYLIPVSGATMQTFHRSQNQTLTVVKECPNFKKRGAGIEAGTV